MPAKSTQKTASKRGRSSVNNLVLKDPNSMAADDGTVSREFRKSFGSSYGNSSKLESKIPIPKGAIFKADKGSTFVDSIRRFRNSAFLQSQWAMAEFWGEKALTLSEGHLQDKFALAEIYLARSEWTRCISFLEYHFLGNDRGRYMAARCLVNLEKWDEALDCLLNGDNENLDTTYSAENSSFLSQESVKIESAISLLKGQIFLHFGNRTKATTELKRAIMCDPRCWDAFEAIITNCLLNPAEENELFDSINFELNLCPQNAEVLKLCYFSRLRSPNNHEETKKKLRKNKDLAPIPKVKAHEICDGLLAEDLDILHGRARSSLQNFDFKDALDTTQIILNRDPFKFITLPIHISCLFHFEMKTELFQLGHQLTQSYPKNAISWYAVAVYYLLVRKYADARKYFSQCTSLNSGLMEGWIGFGHSFAEADEHEQAITAYSTASKLFNGSHLPYLFIGMQYFKLKRLDLALQFTMQSYKICADDPVLLNEIGVIKLEMKKSSEAVEMFQNALNACVSRKISQNLPLLATVYSNLGHAYRREKKWSDSIASYQKALELKPMSASIRVSLGFAYHLSGNIIDAIDHYHYALGLSPENSLANQLLDRAIQLSSRENDDLFRVAHVTTDELMV